MIQVLRNFHVKLKDSHEVIKSLIYLKLLEKNIKITDNDLNVLSLFANENKIKTVAEIAIERNYKLSIRSVENAVSDLVELGLLNKVAIGLREISPDILPKIEQDTLAVDCKIHNIGSR
jgi:predicted transcriptional regulator